MLVKIGIKAVLFDMGGVILKTEDHSFRQKWANQCGIEEKELSAIVFDNEMAKKATLGLISDDDLWLEIYALLKLDPEQGQVFRKEFFAGDRMDSQLIPFINGLRPKSKTCLLSNAWLGARMNISSRFPDWNVFDETIFSAEIQMAKPDPRIFDFAICKLGCLPNEAIFIDDQKANVEAALRFGIHGIRYETTEQIIQDIKAMITP